MRLIPFFALILLSSFVYSQKQPADSFYRPSIHFTPQRGWMNDPNGMFYLDGTYHLFYQHNPFASVWGPMHWGHATSKDLIQWTHQPIALYPDSLGTIFSGSIVVDHQNSSGFGKAGKIPVVAIFTQHNQAAADLGKNDFQTQGIAYSLNGGKSWIKYKGNPVLANPGIKDFRDPKVFWHGQSQQWIMTLAVLDRIHFYGSRDLKVWTKLSEFGEHAGVHNGVWECPDLFPLNIDGKTIWTLIVNIGSGGPNKGSATQYFLGDFDGRHFKPLDSLVRWLDYGPDEYAGVTFSNTPGKKIFLGWMSNWRYANIVPTETWRSAMTVARELHMRKVGEKYFLAQAPINVPSINRLSFTLDASKDFLQVFANSKGDSLIVGYEARVKKFFIDRSGSGQTSFHPEFAEKIWAPRLASNPKIDLTLVMDATSVELFADQGLTTMTAIFFPHAPLFPEERKK